MRRIVFLMLLATPVSASDSVPRLARQGGGIDPFHGAWICVNTRFWDELGHEMDEPNEPLMLRFSGDRVTVRPVGRGVKEHRFRVVESRGAREGRIDFSGERGEFIGRACYRFSADRFFLCTADDESNYPKRCGPGEGHRLYEFVPYQPKRTIQSHPVRPAEPMKGS